MKTWKRWMSCLLAGCLLLALAACGQTTQEEPADETETTQTPEPSQPEEGETAETGNVLVVYFSATGNTEAVAGTIADTLGADVFEITPAEPYTSDDLNWSDENSRVSREYADPSLRTVELETTEVENWDRYDTVFIGYPIWWGIAAWPADSFVAANDFTGKTVIPFCTSSSSGLGDSGTLLEETAGTGTWLEGQRFRGSADPAGVQDWVNGLDLGA